MDPSSIGSWFSESRRKWLYGVAATAVLLLSGYGVIADETAPLWVSLVAAVLWALGNLTAITHTTSVGRAALYGVALSALALLIGYGIIDNGQAGMWAALLAAIFGVGSNMLAGANISPDEPLTSLEEALGDH